MDGLQEDIDRRTIGIQSMCYDAEVAGVQTVVSLAHQEAQLQTIKMSLVSVDTTLLDTKNHITRLKGITRQVMESIRAKVHSKFLSRMSLPSATKRGSSSSLPSASLVVSRSMQREHSSDARFSLSLQRSSTAETVRSTNKPLQEIAVEEPFDQIGHALQRLKGIALEINDQLSGQAVTIKDIQEHMAQSTICIAQQSTQIEKLFS